MKEVISILRKYPKADARSILKQALLSLKPQPPLTPSEVACQNMRIKTKNGGKLPYDIDKTKYMEEPLDLIASREYTNIIFMGPARTGKSEALVKGYATYCISYSYQNLMVVHMTEKKAAEWSKTELKPLIKNSPALSSYLTNDPDDFNIYDLKFSLLNTISNRWPTITNLSAVTVQNVILTDYDRFPENIDGEGNGYLLSKARIRTFGSAGMIVVESSPGYLVTDINQKLGKHDSYNTPGISGLYLLGDKRCYYYQCLKCKEWFIAKPDVIWWDDTLESIQDQAKSARVKCPHCGQKFDNETNQKLLIPNGRWLALGEWLDKEGVKHGQKLINNGIASFQLTAPACAFASLEYIVAERLNAEKHFKETGDETLLQSHYNVTLGVAYIPKYLRGDGPRYNLANNIDITKPKGVCPSDTLFCFATIDIQNGNENGRFEVAIFAYTINNELYLINRLPIETYLGKGLKPHREVTDFDAITKFILTERIKVQGMENAYLKIQGFAMDMGGNFNTTSNAKEFFFRFKEMYAHALDITDGSELEHKIFLFKGAGGKQNDAIKIIKYNKYDASNQSRPIAYSLNTIFYKDIVYSNVSKPFGRELSIHFYNGFPNKYLKEFDSEEKIKGKYYKKKDYNRNETLDLFVYMFAFLDLINVRSEVEKIKKGELQFTPRWMLPLNKGNSNLEIIEDITNYEGIHLDIGSEEPNENKENKEEATKVAEDIEADVRKIDLDTLNLDFEEDYEAEPLPPEPFEFF